MVGYLCAGIVGDVVVSLEGKGDILMPELLPFILEPKLEAESTLEMEKHQF